MTRLTWDQRRFEAGVDRAVLYPMSGPGVPWNGIKRIDEKTEDGSEMITWVDGNRIVVQVGLGTFAADLTAVTYPVQFEKYDGYSTPYSAQKREMFNLSYRTMIGDSDGPGLGYKIHLVYNILATPTDRTNSSLNQDSSANDFTWALSTVPVEVEGCNPTAHFVVNSLTAYPDALLDLENMLYGTDLSVPHFPTIDELIELFESHSILRIIDHGDGSWTAIGPDSVVSILDATSFQISWPSVIITGVDEYVVSSL